MIEKITLSRVIRAIREIRGSDKKENRKSEFPTKEAILTENNDLEKSLLSV